MANKPASVESFCIMSPNGELIHAVAADEFSAWVVFRAVTNGDPIKAQKEGWTVVPVTISPK